MNPFILSSYKSPEFFCDRSTETRKLIDASLNGRNVVLSSLRRMGKTGLIRHVFHLLAEKKETYVFYIDIQETTNLQEFLNKLLNALIRNQEKTIYEKIVEFIKKFRPVISFDPITGNPEIELSYSDEHQSKSSIETVLTYLENLDKKVLVAIDEFQTITSYPESGVEAYLRSNLQHLQNVNFIFSGSSNHLLQAMFYNHNRPFYQSAEMLHLERIALELYTEFISNHFRNSGKHFDNQLIESCILWADNHTFYVQYLMNMLWGSGQKEIDQDLIHTVQNEIIHSRDALYANYSRLLGERQYQLIKAIALNNGVQKPTAGAFLKKYQLGVASTINSALTALLEKELIYKENDMYKVYDVFLAKWFQNKN